MNSLLTFFLILTLAYASLVQSNSEVSANVASARSYESDDYKLDMPFHGILQKFAVTLKNIFTSHRTKLGDLHGKLDDAFHRLLTIEGKTKEYATDYAGSYSGSCKCPEESDVLEYLRKYHGAGSPKVDAKLLQLIPLWSKLAHFEGLLAKNNYILRSYLYLIKKLETGLPKNYLPRNDNITAALTRFVDLGEVNM